ncbi:hypothetical protein GC207_12495 [bacterium]|nr:hypothetical protein [bacterium]
MKSDRATNHYFGILKLFVAVCGMVLGFLTLGFVWSLNSHVDLLSAIVVGVLLFFLPGILVGAFGEVARGLGRCLGYLWGAIKSR